MPNKKMWFLFTREDVLGPFSKTEIFLKANKGDKIWALGLWPVDFTVWQKTHEELRVSAKTAYYLEHEKHIPRTKEEILDLLRPVEEKHLNAIKLYCHDEKKSHTVFEDAALAEGLGVRLRKNVRAKIKGSVLIKQGSQKILAPLFSLSREGLGVELKGQAVSGEIDIFIRSDEFLDVIPVPAKVLYHHENGLLGLKFKELNPFHRQMIEHAILAKEGRVEL